MELSERNIRQLESEDFAVVYEWFDKPGVHHPSHTHNGQVSLLISEGSMDVSFGEELKILNSGDRIDIPAQKEHSVKVGANGCKYVVGQMDPDD